MPINKNITLPKIKASAVRVFNKYIRTRDKDLACISCGSPNTAHASHFYAAGNYELLKFNEDNVHLSCVKCNYWLSGNLVEYRIKLIKRIGIERVEALEQLALQSKRIRTLKRDRFFYQNIIEVYSEKIKQLS